MRKSWEEILEAIWTEDEQGGSSMEGIQSRCPIPIEPEDYELMVKRGLVTVDGAGVKLTYEGRREGRHVVRRHRLAETLFATILDLDAERREAVACEVEHTLLPEVEEAICVLLGHPTLCPNNQPIPPGRCCSTRRNVTTPVIDNLTSLGPGDRGRITFIKPKDHARLHRLASFGLRPGTVIEVHQSAPAYCIRYEGTELAIDRDAAEDIYVTRIR